MKSVLKSHRRSSPASTAGSMTRPPSRAQLRPRLSGRQVQLISHSPAETRRLGERLGHLLKGGAVLAVCGDLGAGKTCFIQGLAKGLEVRETYLPSPTFIFIKKYAGRLTLYHVDLYRIDRASDAEGLGLLECFDQKSVVAIEWAEKAFEFLPAVRITVEIKNRGGKERQLLFRIPVELEYEIEKFRHLRTSGSWGKRRKRSWKNEGA